MQSQINMSTSTTKHSHTDAAQKRRRKHNPLQGFQSRYYLTAYKFRVGRRNGLC